MIYVRNDNMAMSLLKEKIAKKCAICNGEIEKANLGLVCNQCRDRFKKP